MMMPPAISAIGRFRFASLSSALIEVGAQTNTYEEAVNAMDPLAQLLDQVLMG